MKINDLLEDYLNKLEAVSEYLRDESFSADVYNQLRLLMETLNGKAYLLPNGSVLCPDNDGCDYSILELIKE